ncbi:hypothetical protein D8Y22_08975 [Salinadaptatus halalkaliphilus]|uniref:Protein-glutamine gamma-glutamyltransferase-like C-terminal domain-containing protein n=1 Tax=Salinadaptatus halalkaliphilus TaxID=2419781 RepID=A0A4S3TM97_9EURY|nr:DUF4129 domain-containing protein [Salinadaptatus halalkaliphilus]THE65312.1 hypothetical protein D8Y22_08975 [Salinadaptatus halalkaliphilus]
MSDDAAVEASSAGIDYRQVSLVAVAALAVVLAAFVAPAVVGTDESDGPSNTVDTPGDGEGDAGEGTEPTFDWFDLLEWLGWTETPTEDSIDGETACTIQLDAGPTPGDDVTATIHHEREPVTDARVWFNDRGVGVTDERGQVTGEVPYESDLEVRVATGEGGECRAATETLDGFESAGLTAPGSVGSIQTAVRSIDASIATTESSLEHSRRHRVTGQHRSLAAQLSTVQSDDATNATAAYEVDGEVSIVVDGAPDPGSAIDLEAHIDGVPMAAADVSVDGDRVAETDRDGEASVTVPDDGTEELELAVSRGEFDGTTTLEVRLLEATLRADAIAPIPGSDGTVVAELADDGADDATVTVDGDYRGTTDDDGTAPITLPLDPTAPITVGTGDQTARTTLVGAYGGPVTAISMLVFVTAGVAYRTHGRRGPTIVLGVATAVLAALIAEAFYGAAGGLLVLGVGTVGALALAAARSSRELDPRAGVTERPSVRGVFGRTVEWLLGHTLVVVGVLEAVVDRAWAAGGGLAAWLRSLPRSVSGLARRLAGWLGVLPRRTLAGCRRGLGALTGHSSRLLVGLGGLVGAVSLVGVGYALGGPAGGLLTAGVLVVGVVGVLAARSAEETSVADTSTTTAPSDSASTLDSSDGDDFSSVRSVWRFVASTVAPREWRTSAPAEIERRAIEAGVPPVPMAELTTLFRELEYGDREPSREAREQAMDAYARVADALEAGPPTEQRATAAMDSASAPGASAAAGEPTGTGEASLPDERSATGETVPPDESSADDETVSEVDRS